MGNEGEDAENEEVENGDRVAVDTDDPPPDQNEIAYGSLPTSTPMIKGRINNSWDGST